MTDTLEHTATEAATPTVLRASFNAATLADLATMATVCGDSSRPIIAAIHLVGDGATVTATATDSYRLARFERGYSDSGDAFEVLIEGKAFAAAVKSIKGWATLEIEGNAWRLVGYEATIGGIVTMGDYPSLDKIIPAEDSYKVGGARVAFNPTFLADMGKLAPIATAPAKARKTATLELVSAPDNSHPTVWRVRCNAYDAPTLYILMPVRIS